MADEEEIVVKVEGDQPGGDDVVVHQDDAVAELKKQYEALEADNKRRQEREAEALRRAGDADRRAQEARRAADDAVARASASETNSIDAGIAAAQAEASQAEADYAAAMEKGDFAAAAKAQRRIASAEAKAVRLDEAKSDLEARKSAGGGEDRAPARSSDPFEDHLTKFTPRTADWMRNHRDWVTDPRKSAKLTGAHHMAVGDGLTPDTDEYFEAVEKTLGLREAEAPPARNGNGNEQRNPPARRSAPPVAPVNGGAGAHSSGAADNRGNVVRLTKAEAASATDGTLVWNYDDPSGKKRFKKGDPIGHQEMARRKQAMQNQGLYDKNNIEA